MQTEDLEIKKWVAPIYARKSYNVNVSLISRSFFEYLFYVALYVIFAAAVFERFVRVQHQPINNQLRILNKPQIAFDKKELSYAAITFWNSSPRTIPKFNQWMRLIAIIFIIDEHVFLSSKSHSFLKFISFQLT